MPPDQKPAGQNVQWIPGYWSWDVSRNDYLWVSGIWREPPPNSQWVPGYWHQVEGGSQWVPGTWIPVELGSRRRDRLRSARPAVLPAAAAAQSLETGPTTPQPRPQRGLDARLLVVARVELRLAARLLGGRSAQLDLDARALRLDAQRLSVRRRILGSAGRQSRADVRAGVLPSAGLCPAQLRLHAVDQHRRLGGDRQPVRVRRARTSISSATSTLRTFVSVGITPWFSFSICDGPAALLRPAVLVLRGDQHAAEPGLGGAGPSSITSCGATTSRCGRRTRTSSRRG